MFSVWHGVPQLCRLISVLWIIDIIADINRILKNPGAQCLGRGLASPKSQSGHVWAGVTFMGDSGGHLRCMALSILLGPWALAGSVDANY